MILQKSLNISKPMPKYTYDPEVKILSIRFKDGKSVDSDMKDNVVLDYDQKGHLVNIDIMGVNIEDIVKSASGKLQKAPAKRRLMKTR